MQQLAAVRGTGNPQRMHEPLWEELIRSGETAYRARKRYGIESDVAGWCFDRFGMTRTRLPDGRTICIGGEHEDHYDPDFFIYNDVIVISPDGEIEIYGYSPDVFPPTDSHTATLVGEMIYVIGRIGYGNDRGRGSTPIFQLNTRTMRMRPVASGGTDPGWIFHHRAELLPDGKCIRISGGDVITPVNEKKEEHRENESDFIFDSTAETWSKIDQTRPQKSRRGEELAVLGWPATANHEDARHLHDSISRAVSFEHPLFTDAFWPIAERQEWPRRIILQMFDGSERWAICDRPGFDGREDPPSLLVEFFPAFEDLIDAIERLGDDVQ